MKLRGIVFDLDGTLVDSLGLSHEAFNHGIFKVIGKTLTRQELTPYFGAHELEIFAQVVGREKAKAAHQAHWDFLRENLSRIPLHEGVSQLLDQLLTQSVPIAVFTGRGLATTTLILEHHGISDRFVTVVATDQIKAPKPSPEGLHLALSRMKLEPAEILFVGDSAMDMKSAHSAKAHGVAAIWDSLADHEALKATDPHHWAECPAQVWEVFNQD